MVLTRDFVYIAIMFSIIAFSDGGRSIYDDHMKATQVTVKKETTPHGGQRTTIPHSDQRTTIPHSDQRTTIPHSDQRTTIPHSDQRTTIPHSDQRTTIPHSDQRTTIPHSDQRTTIPHSDQRTTIPHSDQRTTIPHSDQRTTIPHSDQRTTIPHSDQRTTIPHSEQMKLIPQGETTQPSGISETRPRVSLMETTSHDLLRKTTSLDGRSETILETVQSKTYSGEIESVSTTNNVDPCQIKVVEWGRNYFRGQLFSKEPQFVQFKIKQVGNVHYKTTKDVFEPFRWSWTYKDGSVPLPFTSWKLDYGILSFHLLETKTIFLDHEIELDVSKGCNVTYGSDETVENIVNAFLPLMDVSVHNNSIPTYTESYFCYYQIKPAEFSTAKNILYRYFVYNLKIVEYKCAEVSFDYMTKHFVVKTTCEDCIHKRLEWEQFGVFTLVFAVLTLLFCSPIIVFSIGQWVAKHEKIIANEVAEEPFEDVYLESDIEDDWLYADGINHPLNISDVCSFDRLGLAAKYPAFIGRLRRLIFILMIPLFIYIQLIMFDQGMGMSKHDKVTIESLVKRGVPLGFLSLLGDPENMKYCFVYWLGGPVGMTCLYFSLSFLFIVLPRSLKQIIEDGIPSSKRCFKSPLFLTFYQTMRFSNVINKYSIIPSGHSKAIMVIKCRFYMLFSTPFWQCVWTTQTTRWFQMCSGTSTCWCILRYLSLPLYLAMCVVEICCCLVFYAIPFCSFVTIVVKGATKSLGYLQRQNRILGLFFSFRIAFMFVFIVYILYTYIISLVFMKSLLIICQIITYCFLAVIMYPSVAFGYLFFFTVMLYYLIGLVRSFSDGYMELLVTAVKLSRQVDANTDYVYTIDGHLNVLNLRMNQITDVKINGTLLDVSQDILRSLEEAETIRVRVKNSVYGVPKVLFDKLVKEFRPVHREVLSLCFKVAVLMVFVAALLTISGSIKSGPNSEISEVMHVVFVVVVSTLPKLLSSILSQSHDGLLKEIEERRIKDVIITYWHNVDREMA